MSDVVGTWSQEALGATLMTRFRALDEMTNALPLVLVRIYHDAGRPNSTLLLLRGPVQLTWHEDSYTLQHAQLGQFLVHLRPVDRDAEGVYYEAQPIAEALQPQVSG